MGKKKDKPHLSNDSREENDEYISIQKFVSFIETNPDFIKGLKSKEFSEIDIKNVISFLDSQKQDNLEAIIKKEEKFSKREEQLNVDFGKSLSSSNKGLKLIYNHENGKNETSRKVDPMDFTNFISDLASKKQKSEDTSQVNYVGRLEVKNIDIKNTKIFEKANLEDVLQAIEDSGIIEDINILEKMKNPKFRFLTNDAEDFSYRISKTITSAFQLGRKTIDPKVQVLGNQKAIKKANDFAMDVFDKMKNLNLDIEEKSLREIANLFNENKISAKQGGEWKAETIKSLKERWLKLGLISETEESNITEPKNKFEFTI